MMSMLLSYFAGEKKIGIARKSIRVGVECSNFSNVQPSAVPARIYKVIKKKKNNKRECMRTQSVLADSKV